MLRGRRLEDAMWIVDKDGPLVDFGKVTLCGVKGAIPDAVYKLNDGFLPIDILGEVMTTVDAERNTITIRYV